MLDEPNVNALSRGVFNPLRPQPPHEDHLPLRDSLSARFDPTANAAVFNAESLPVQIHALGTFRVLIDGRPLKFDRKAQKRPLELLKVLIALGGRDGAEVREERLTEAMWPHAEADAAAVALTSTIYRVRKLIGKSALIRREGCLSLNPRHCWVDAWALEHHLSTLENACQRQQFDQLIPLSQQTLAMHRGPFLDDHPEAPWVLSARERLRSKVLRKLDLAAQALSHAKQHDLAVRCLEKALEVDALAECFYRKLMQVHLAQGHRAEALSIYRRCRKLLAIHLGLEPSAPTEAVLRQIQAA
jgi:DNA-binding SARP family transcriptional activator